MANMRTVATQLQIYQNDTAIYPAGSLSMSQVADALLVVSNKPVPIADAWGSDFDYQSDGQSLYTVESFGRDGVPGANITPAQSNNFDLDIVINSGEFVAAVR